jgi:hypothetical protein
MRALSRRGASTPSVSNVSGYLESADAQQRNSIPASPAIPAAAKQQEDENKDDEQRCIVHELASFGHSSCLIHFYAR